MQKCLLEAPRPTTISEPQTVNIDTDDDEVRDSIDRIEKSTEQQNNPEEEEENHNYVDSAEYKCLLTEINQNLLCAIKLQLKNTSALVRRVAVLLLELMAKTNLDIDQILLSYVS